MIRSFLIVSFLFLSFSLMAQTKVMVMEIKTEIDTRTSRYVKLALEEAANTKADVVLLEMNTYGGGVTDAVDIVQMLLKFEKPVWVYINTNAASAGALISIACDSIYMSGGSSIGAATVVDGEGIKAIDKYQSYMRSVMRSTAEENHRDTTIAQGMVEENFAIPGLKKVGQVITFSTSEAIKYGFCEGKAESIEEILKKNKITNYTITRFELGTVEKVIAFFLNPYLSGLLIMLILAGIYFEMQAPGLGFAGAVALIALLLYLIPYYLNGLATNWEILVLLLGFALLAAEIFVIPGFGVAGISGIILVLVSLVLIMVNNDVFDFGFVPESSLMAALLVSMGGLLGGVVLFFLVGNKLLDNKHFRKIALANTQDSKDGYVATTITDSMNGKTGIAHTVLRPSGKVLIEGQFYDAYSRGEYIDKGEAIEVVAHETTSLKVKKIQA
ncbi:NfeD family protein [Pseudochryseolinea flava]|uniref:Nodulation protein NfeD n=1 Tax=Pseudochryseolinea flava TaxID=2059302 RepID=A0A364XVF8_9BACT|nr:NfeD family protein [Pseudochryseolinea flava]RAV98337.1 nodulation protein NfeD [Pseudochryseolinea flava]